MTKIVVGVDVSKATFDVALLVPGRTTPSQAVFDNCPAGFKKLECWLQGRTDDKPDVCMESTGIYGQDLATYLVGAGCRVSIVNPARIKAYGTSEMTRNKTDRSDAVLIAKYCLRHDLAAWSPPDPTQVRLRGIVRCLHDLERDRVRILCRLESIKDEAIRSFWHKGVQFLDERIRLMQKERDSLCKEDPTLAKRRDLLKSIPGVGQRTALIMLAELPDLDSFDSAKQLAAFAGLTPANRVSGSSIRGHTRLSKRGSRSLRAALFLPAMTAIRCNPAVQALARRMTDRGKSKMAILGAAMRKLLHIIYGVLKSGMPFQVVAAS